MRLALIFAVFYAAGFMHALCAVSVFATSLVGLIRSEKYKLARIAASKLSPVLAGLSVLILTAYVSEFCFAFYCKNPYEFYDFWQRIVGPYAVLYWTKLLAGYVLPQLFWIPRVRCSMVTLYFGSFIVVVATQLNT